ncbi:unnamed protein product [Caenorhabditis sp. 36 PRJEB53466]|nr:unnamed protein product [Caenorhabditis sp. 36 PRJEB53466]
MDFNESGVNFDEMLLNDGFSPHFDQLELDSLLYGNDESQDSSSSSSFAFGDQNAGFRSRDGGSLGDSSSDSSPPLSCANFTENDQEMQEMWEFGFQNPSPFEPQYNKPSGYQEEEVICRTNDDFIHQQYVEHEELIEDPMVAPPKRIIAILPRQQNQMQNPVRKMVTRPIQKIYRVKEIPANHSAQTCKIAQPVNQQRMVQRPLQQKAIFYTKPVEMRPQPQSGPLIRQTFKKECDQPRFVPIAPTRDIKHEIQHFTPEQNRKIRNRMYAQASRIRKKEAEESLRMRVDELSHKNEMLVSENAILKRRLAFYEGESALGVGIRPLPPQGNAQKQKKMIAAGTVLMMFGLFAIVSPFNVLTTDNNMGVPTEIMAIANETSVVTRHSRVLGNEGITAIITKPPEPIIHFSNSSHPDCEMYKLNATETERVNNDIERWVQVHSFDNVPMKFTGGLLNQEAMRKFNEAQKVQKASIFGPQTASAQKKSEQAAIRSRERTWRQLNLLKTGSGAAQVDSEKIHRKRQNIDKLASIVRQKGDTLYIMTLQDYVLLPSLKKGANSIPKLSLLLPSVPMNGTLLDQYTFLRVDCEVTGTGQLTLSSKQLSYLMP